MLWGVYIWAFARGGGLGKACGERRRRNEHRSCKDIRAPANPLIIWTMSWSVCSSKSYGVVSKKYVALEEMCKSVLASSVCVC